MSQPVVHWEINGTDGPTLQAFYGTLFDWQIEVMEPFNYGMMQPNGEGGIGGGIGGAETPSVTFYVEVPDLQAALTKAESLGGSTVMPPMDVMEGIQIAMFADPEGNKIGLLRG